MGDTPGPTRRPIRPRVEKVPPAIRPGDTDDVLEGPRLTRISVWGLIMSLLLAGVLFLYWVNEPSRMTSMTKTFHKDSIVRGEQYFALPTNDKTGATNTRGIGCARCHGDDATGGTNHFLNSVTGLEQDAKAPDLTTVFRRYAKPPIGYKAGADFILETIERGRTNGALGDGDDMPTWGQKYGGPLTDQQINDVTAWLESVQK
jgi:cytochrome c553